MEFGIGVVFEIGTGIEIGTGGMRTWRTWVILANVGTRVVPEAVLYEGSWPVWPVKVTWLV